MDLLYASIPFASSTTSSSFFSRYSVLVSELEMAEGERAFVLYQELIPLCTAWQEALTTDIDRQDQESAIFLQNISLDDCEASVMFIERYRETVDRLRSSVERLKAAIISTSEMAVAAQREILSGMRAGAPAATLLYSDKTDRQAEQAEVVKKSCVWMGWIRFLTRWYALVDIQCSI
ncbi:hypothetical protein R1flu_002338 [Riccia fluitans]|uniref:Uncharacterized protein n=1 Tax=Riccia fluitans TaxID=41844 RepID=A0ABD1Y5S5_9MARC